MKITSSPADTSTETLTQQQILERQKQSAKAASDATSLSIIQNVLGGDSTQSSQNADGGDSVSVSSLASALSGELNPTQMSAERQTKLDQIKAQIANGTYKPSSESVAKALAAEISSEILSTGGLLAADN